MKHGFSLLELAVVLLIIGFLTGGGLALGIALLQRQGVDRTNEKLDVIQKTLLSYAKAYGYLPCPAQIDLEVANANYGSGTGTGAAAPGSCSAAVSGGASIKIGALPTKDLQLPDHYLVDGFGRAFTYLVDERMTAAGATNTYTPTTPLPGASITVLPEIPTSGSRVPRTTAAIYAIVSHGANGHGAYSGNGPARRYTGSTNADEWENCDCNATTAPEPTTTPAIVVQKRITGIESSASTTFDDIVRYSLLVDLSNR